MQKSTFARPQKNQTNSSVQTQSSEPKGSKFFEIMFVRNDEDQSIEVYESTVLDFNAIIENLNEGNSIFIAQKNRRDKSSSKKKQQKSNYNNHI